MTSSRDKPLEGVFFIHGQTIIREDWCPFCNKWTEFGSAVIVKMDHIEKRKLDCGHEITYIFLIEHVHGEKVEAVRRRVC